MRVLHISENYVNETEFFERETDFRQVRELEATYSFDRFISMLKTEWFRSSPQEWHFCFMGNGGRHYSIRIFRAIQERQRMYPINEQEEDYVKYSEHSFRVFAFGNEHTFHFHSYSNLDLPAGLNNNRDVDIYVKRYIYYKKNHRRMSRHAISTSTDIRGGVISEGGNDIPVENVELSFRDGGVVGGYRASDISMNLSREPMLVPRETLELFSRLRELEGSAGNLGQAIAAAEAINYIYEGRNPPSESYIKQRDEMFKLIDLKLKSRSLFDKKTKLELSAPIYNGAEQKERVTGTFEEVLTYGNYSVVRPTDVNSIKVGGNGLHNCLRHDANLVKYNPKNIFFLIKNTQKKNPFKVCIYLNHNEILGKPEVLKGLRTEIKTKKNENVEGVYLKTLSRFFFYIFNYKLKHVLKINGNNHFHGETVKVEYAKMVAQDANETED